MAIHHSIATSTIAMSIYNVIAVARRPLQKEEILAGMRAGLGERYELADLDEALTELVKRGWVIRDSLGLFEIVDAEKRRIIRSRACNDFKTQNGKTVGGWAGWSTACNTCPGVMLDDIAKEAA